MNILIYENAVSPKCGGVQRVSVNLAKLLVAHGHKVFVAHRNALGDDTLPTCFEGAIQISTDCLEDAKRLADYAKQEKCGLFIHQQAEILEKRRQFWEDFRNEWKGYFLGCLHTTPWFYYSGFKNKDWSLPGKSLHALIQQIGHFFYPKDRFILRTACDLPDRLLLLSKGFIADYETIANRKADESKIKICPNFLPDSFLPPADFSLNEKENIALFVGRLEEYPKNISMLLSIWRQLERRFPDWTFCIVGDGPQMSHYQKIAANLRNVKFIGHADPTPFYRQASILFIASLWEGLPMVMLEAMAYGVVPVVHRASSAMEDILQDDGGGIIVPYMDRNAFLHEAAAVMQDSARRLSLGRQAMQNIHENFSESAAWRHWNGIIKEIGDK